MPTTMARTRNRTELAGGEGEPESEVAQGDGGQRGEQDADPGAEQGADDRGDDALVATTSPYLALGRADGAQQAELARRSWTAKNRLLAMPNSEITRLIASSA